MDIEQFKATLRALPEDVKWGIKWELDRVLDSMPLVTIGACDIVADMEEEGYKHERLPELAARAAYRVYSKHSGDPDAHSAAVEWGVDLVHEYAKEDGITLSVDETADA